MSSIRLFHELRLNLCQNNNTVHDYCWVAMWVKKHNTVYSSIRFKSACCTDKVAYFYSFQSKIKCHGEICICIHFIYHYSSAATSINITEQSGSTSCTCFFDCHTSSIHVLHFTWAEWKLTIELAWQWTMICKKTCNHFLLGRPGNHVFFLQNGFVLRLGCD